VAPVTGAGAGAPPGARGVPGGCDGRSGPVRAPLRPRRGTGTPGAAGLGDAYFPGAGNGGYDVRHYDVSVHYAGPRTGRIDATVSVMARATQDLSSFDLDFRGPRIVGVAVDGRSARYRRKGGELVITPPGGISKGASFTAVVRYAGVPAPLRDDALGTYGWVPSKDGAVVAAEPDGAPTWLPVNDHPRDKATYAFHVTVPKDLRVLANGRPGRVARHGGTATYDWAEESPMASYLAMIAIGRFQVRRTRTGAGIPVITAVDPRTRASVRELEATTVKVLDWASTVFGRYPFATAGGIVDDPRLDYALETQERPVYGGFAPDEDFVVHELAHQWFGDSVSIRRWQDIWLNEGFATYAEWLWAERGGRDSAKKIFDRYYRQPADSPVFVPPAGRPGARGLFGFAVYVRGAMCLQALRDRVGDRAFFTILRTWADGRRGSAVTTAQFVAHAEHVAGRRLGGLFDAWLYRTGKPQKW
uniref:M1 family metallopeptidase n=1 Tax=Actinomadura roseirufa TaxID=2094049 RepID=UPI0027956DB0